MLDDEIKPFCVREHYTIAHETTMHRELYDKYTIRLHEPLEGLDTAYNDGVTIGKIIYHKYTSPKPDGHIYVICILSKFTVTKGKPCDPLVEALAGKEATYKSWDDVFADLDACF